MRGNNMFTDLYEKLLAKEEKLSLVGLGYVGMPIAVAFAKKINVVGFDLNAKKIELYKSGVDPTNEVGDEAIKNTTVDFTADISCRFVDLQQYFIIKCQFSQVILLYDGSTTADQSAGTGVTVRESNRSLYSIS